MCNGQKYDLADLAHFPPRAQRRAQSPLEHRNHGFHLPTLPVRAVGTGQTTNAWNAAGGPTLADLACEVGVIGQVRGQSLVVEAGELLEHPASQNLRLGKLLGAELVSVPGQGTAGAEYATCSTPGSLDCYGA